MPPGRISLYRSLTAQKRAFLAWRHRRIFQSPCGSLRALSHDSGGNQIGAKFWEAGDLSGQETRWDSVLNCTVLHLEPQNLSETARVLGHFG